MATRRKPKTTPAKAIDDQLKRYRAMRDFSITREPAGGRRSKQGGVGLPFVVQKHAASRLHYDFRLGWNGVLKSWAIAKGPSYYPKDKRLAVQVEDHPIEYGGFEGIIPQGQYGGGTVMLWDEGTWEPQPDHLNVDAGLRDGSLKFTLHGSKLKGNWALIRMNGKAANERKPNWLLIKEHDDFERSGNEQPITEEAPDSVVTRRSLEEIAQSGDHVWGAKDAKDGHAGRHKVAKATAKSFDGVSAHAPAGVGGNAHKSSRRQLTLDVDAYPKESLPKFIPPQLALQSDRPSTTPGWLHELKLDGYRIQAHKDGDRVHLYTRTGLDWTHRMSAIAAAVGMLAVEQAIFDGEVVVFSSNGTTSFADLQASFQEAGHALPSYVIFDLLYVNGRNLRGAPLVDRKEILRKVLVEADGILSFSEHLAGTASTIFNKACELHAEGIISKRASGAYQSGRSGDWLKLKCARQQEFVIGGFTLPTNGMHGIGSLLLGYYDAHGHLIYAGRTGTGFTRKIHGMLRDKVDALRAAKKPFATVPADAVRDAIWIKPELVAQVHFATWTRDNLVRQASFKGLREDKPAKEVRREEASMNSPSPEKADAPLAARRSAHSASAPRLRKEAAADSSAPIQITRPDKVLDAESGLTKQRLADYYWAIAESMLPQIADRPISLVRCPEGSTQPCFFQKHTNSSLPPGIETVQIKDKKTGKPEPYITLSTRESLAGLAQMGVLEVHPWGCTNDDVEHPDRIIIDLDPDESVSWRTLAASAQTVRKLFSKVNLESFLKSTGGKGLHVVVPIVPEHEWSAIKEFAHEIALLMVRLEPSLYIAKMSKAARVNRIFVDYLRNERGATAVAAFSPRARAGAPVSIPLAWNELKLSAHPRFHVAEFKEWKSRLTRNPWKKLPLLGQKLDLAKSMELLRS